METAPSQEAPVSIVHVIPQDAVGGVEVAARSMLAGSACDFRILLIAGRGLMPHPSIIEGSRGPAIHPMAQLRAIRRITRLAPDLLICSLWRSVPVCIVAKLLRPRMRLAYFLHLERAMHWPDAIFARLAMWMADVVLADSAITLRARGVPRRKPRRIISFVLDRPTALPSGRQATPAASFVTWSRLNYQKGIDRALHLVALLVRRGIDPRFDIWGPDGGELSSLKQLAESLGLSGRVAFRGPLEREQLSSIAAEHSFFLQLSRFEGMAMGTVEAMQMGLVPVTTNVGQMGEYVRPGETGVIVKPDELETAADRIGELLANPSEYAALRASARQLWQQSPLYSDDICGLAQELVRRRPAAAGPQSPAGLS